jgi:hypothetical protein
VESWEEKFQGDGYFLLDVGKNCSAGKSGGRVCDGNIYQAFMTAFSQVPLQRVYSKPVEMKNSCMSLHHWVVKGSAMTQSGLLRSLILTLLVTLNCLQRIYQWKER